jgi:hypothetical protein
MFTTMPSGIYTRALGGGAVANYGRSRATN